VLAKFIHSHLVYRRSLEYLPKTLSITGQSCTHPTWLPGKHSLPSVCGLVPTSGGRVTNIQRRHSRETQPRLAPLARQCPLIAPLIEKNQPVAPVSVAFHPTAVHGERRAAKETGIDFCAAGGWRVFPCADGCFEPFRLSRGHSEEGAELGFGEEKGERLEGFLDEGGWQRTALAAAPLARLGLSFVRDGRVCLTRWPAYLRTEARTHGGR
jgi:hypothetical protein